MKPRTSTRPPKLVYRVVANVDSRFPSAEAALSAYSGMAVPEVPATVSDDLHEDATTPRVCVAGRVRDCFTAIGLLGRFRRCLSANRDALSYAAAGREVYPVILQTFDGKDAIRPTLRQVPDWPWTNEFWITEPVAPLKTELLWLDMWAIKMAYVPDSPRTVGYACTSVTFTRPGPDSDHPWLNGRGHVLESSEYESPEEETPT